MPPPTKQRPDILSFSVDDRFRRLDSVSEAQGHMMERVLFETRHQAADVQRLLASRRANPLPMVPRFGPWQVVWLVAISVASSVLTTAIFLFLVSRWR